MKKFIRQSYHIFNKKALLAFMLLFSIASNAQDIRSKSLVNAERNGWEFEMKAGVNIGGATPMPIPVEIRSIESYNPRLNASLEGVATKWLGSKQKWGISAGLKLEQKGMETGATTKAYSTEIINEGNRVAGYWTGHVKTKYNSTFLTIPIMANYQINTAWKVRGGLFASVRVDGEFLGHVSDGYLREGNPTGEKLLFTDGKRADYDFSSDLNHLNWGAQVGGTWRAYRHFTVNADLTWAFKDIFKKDFKTITFSMYPVYLNLGFGYVF